MKSDKIYLSLALILIIITLSWITSCTHQANIVDIPEICFDRDVLPIFTNSCAISGCHDGGGESHLALDNYVDISHSVVPGNPNSSRIYQAITATWGENKMPPNRPLSLENRTIIRLWIEQGAGLTLCDTTGTGGRNSNGTARACFTRDILPVLVSRCATIASSGLLINSLKGTGVTKMPPAGSFSTCRIRQFEIWVNNGFLNN